MMARLEMGDVLLTARMSNVFLRFRQPVLARNGPFAKFHPKGVMIQGRQARGLGKGEPPPRVLVASQFDLHVALTFSRPQRETGERLLVEFKRDAHAQSVAVLMGDVNLPERHAFQHTLGAVCLRGHNRAQMLASPRAMNTQRRIQGSSPTMSQPG